MALSRIRADAILQKFVIGEVPSGAVDSVNTTYMTANTFFFNSISVFINGVQGNILSISESGGVGAGHDTIEIEYPPEPGDEVTVNYIIGEGSIGAVTSSPTAGNNALSSGWLSTGVAEGEAVYASANNTLSQANSAGPSPTGSFGILKSPGTVQHAGAIPAQLETGLTLSPGDRLYVSKTTPGALTNDVSGFVAGDLIQPMGDIRDTSGYVGTTPGDSILEIIVRIGESRVV